MLKLFDKIKKLILRIKSSNVETVYYVNGPETLPPPLSKEEENELMGVPSSIQIYEPVGCPNCNNTGYKGRTAIHEIIHCTAKVSAIIAAGGGKEEIEAAAKANGTKLLRDNAAELVQAGQTSIDELVRSTFSV